MKKQSMERRTMDKREERQRAVVRDLRFGVMRIVVVIALLYVLFTYVLTIRVMDSEDMSPAVAMHDLCFFYRLPETLHASDVVLYRRDGLFMVGRIVAGPGDIVEVNGHLRVNGSTILEPRIYQTTPEYEGGVDYPVVLGEDEYFMLGDRREGAADSRYYGPIRKEEIEGILITLFRRQGL
ncbi:MAG: signal peptidase I [Clostridia bacterium]|nr:signal peptidase I [Clostridia bacterium]